MSGMWAERGSSPPSSGRGRAGRFVLAASFLLAGFAMARPGRAGELTGVAGLGLFGAENAEHVALMEIEFRFAPRRFSLRPVVGAAGSSDGAAYLRLGLGRDFRLAERWNANVSLCGTGYHKGGGKDLGRGFEFRSALDVGYEIRPGYRLGFSVAHLSNGGIDDRNPGIETYTFTFAVSDRAAARH
jgi:lipid A 3-O-deacylase